MIGVRHKDVTLRSCTSSSTRKHPNAPKRTQSARKHQNAPKRTQTHPKCQKAPNRIQGAIREQGFPAANRTGTRRSVERRVPVQVAFSQISFKRKSYVVVNIESRFCTFKGPHLHWNSVFLDTAHRFCTFKGPHLHWNSQEPVAAFKERPVVGGMAQHGVDMEGRDGQQEGGTV